MSKILKGIIFYSIIISFSCSEDDERKEIRNTIFPIKPGNYWIYQIKGTSADGVVGMFPYLDSVYILKDTIINHSKYWIQTGTLSGTVYLRDSADCVILRQLTYEQIIYSTNRDTLLRDPPFYKLITDVNEVTEVPAGKFPTINCRSLLRKDPSNAGHDTEFPSFSKNFYTVEQYKCSADVGLVKLIYYYLGGTIEQDLVRYSVK
jgi:hypothetical protein